MPFFGYLSEFWNEITSSIASTTASTIEYGADFFQNIGNAVSGAISGVFIFIFQPVIDFFLAIFYGVSQLVYLVFSPIVGVVMYIYGFISGVVSTLSSGAVTSRYEAIIAGGQFDSFLDNVDGINNFLNLIPGFSIIQVGASAVILALAIVWLFKLITQ